jgi:prevent-host-death family protein
MTRSAQALAKPVRELHEHTDEIVGEVERSGVPVTITRGRKAAVVLLPALEYDNLYRRYMVEAIERGEADADAGRLHSHDEVLRDARALIASRKRETPRPRRRTKE